MTETKVLVSRSTSIIEPQAIVRVTEIESPMKGFCKVCGQRAMYQVTQIATLRGEQICNQSYTMCRVCRCLGSTTRFSSGKRPDKNEKEEVEDERSNNPPRIKLT